MNGYRTISRLNEMPVGIYIVENINDGSRYILKHYPSVSAKNAELYWFDKLTSSKDIRISKVVKSDDLDILIEYSGGNTLLHDIATGPIFRLSVLAEFLARYIKAFYRESGGFVLDEMDLSGYIQKGGLFIAFDFVSARMGLENELISEAVASVLVNRNIADNRKQIFIRELVKAFGGTVIQYKNDILKLVKDKLDRSPATGVTAEGLYKLIGKV